MGAAGTYETLALAQCQEAALVAQSEVASPIYPRYLFTAGVQNVFDLYSVLTARYFVVIIVSLMSGLYES